MNAQLTQLSRFQFSIHNSVDATWFGLVSMQKVLQEWKHVNHVIDGTGQLSWVLKRFPDYISRRCVFDLCVKLYCPHNVRKNSSCMIFHVFYICVSIHRVEKMAIAKASKIDQWKITCPKNFDAFNSLQFFEVFNIRRYGKSPLIWKKVISLKEITLAQNSVLNLTKITENHQ